MPDDGEWREYVAVRDGEFLILETVRPPLVVYGARLSDDR